MKLRQQQIDQYFEDGFIIVEDLFTRDELQPEMDELAQRVEDMAQRLYETGRIKNKHEDRDFYTRLTYIENEFDGAAPLLLLKYEMRLRLMDLWYHDKLLEIVEQFIGPDIAGHPAWNIRPKTPETVLLTVPWHQDVGYFEPGSEETFKVNAWIPMIDATYENGTLQVIRGGHKGRPKVCRHNVEHKVGDPRSWQLYIKKEDLPEGEVVTCEMKLGSVLFMNDFTPHRSPQNLSKQVRWSVDLRWQRPGKPTGMDKAGSIPLLMRKTDDPAFKPDLEGWAERNNRIFAAYAGRDEKAEFDIDATDAAFLKRWEEPDAA